MHELFVAGACVLALFSNYTPSSPQPEPASLLQCSPERDLQAVLAEARELAAAIPVTHSQDIVSYVEYLRTPGGASYMRPGSDYRSRTIPLTMLHPATGELRTTVITRTITNGTLPRFLISDDGVFMIALEERPSGTAWNWWNTSFTVLAPQGWVVAADNWKRHPSNVSMVYTPFSAGLALAFPELIELGKQHLDEDVTQALAHLRRIPSRVDRTKSVSDVIEEHLPDLAHAVVSVEHADPYDVKSFKQGIGSFDPLLRPFVIFGSNTETAFNATRSSAGAQGLMQVMPKTWSDMQALYPSARLPSRDSLPSHSHPMEIVAGLLTADYHLSLLAGSARKRGISLDELLVRHDLQFLALASFNGGPGRVGAQLKNPQWRERLHPETRGYLAKFDQFTR